MANFLFQVTSSTRDVYYVLGVGADGDAAKADAIAKWTAWADAQSNPDDLKPEQDVKCLSTDDDIAAQTAAMPRANLVV